MKLKWLIKVLVSIIMIALVLRIVDAHKLQDTFLKIPLSSAILVILGYALGQVLSSYKWWLIASSGGRINVGWPRALKAYFLGAYANCFGLGVVGGDVIRAMALAGKDSSKSQAVASVVADRAHGLAILVVMGLVFSLFDGRDTISADFVYVITLLPVFVVLGWFFGPKIILKFLSVDHPLYQKIHGIFEVFPKEPFKLFYISMISLVFHMSQMALHYYMALSLGLKIPWVIILSSIPFVNVLCSLPISWNGLGVRENSYIFFLVPDFAAKEDCIALGALWLLAVTGSSAIGGIFSALSKKE